MKTLSKITAVSLALVCVLMLFVSSGCEWTKKYAKSTEIDNESFAAGKTGQVNWTFNKELKTIIISGEGAMNLTFPSQNPSYPWDDYKSDIEKVIVKDGVTMIPFMAFMNCHSLKSVELGDSVKLIEYSAFQYCEKLRSVKLSENLTYIESEAFSGCGKLESVKFPKGLLTIESAAFSGCSSLSEVELPDIVYSIESGVFQDCVKLKSVKFPKLLTNIDDRAFSGCSSLSTVELPDTIEHIGIDAFADTKFQEKAQFTDGVWYQDNYLLGTNDEAKGNLKIKQGTKIIAEGSFKGNTRLKSVLIPSSVTVVSDDAFSECTLLKKVTIEQGVERIKGAFENCPKLTQAYIPESVSDFGNRAFLDAPSELKIYGAASSAAEEFAKKNGYEFVEE